MTDKIDISKREMYGGIFLIGVTCLMYELVQVRLLAFFLGGISNFLAIPLALFGLALGSMFCHFVYKGSKAWLIRYFSIAAFPSMVLVFILFFIIANAFFADIHIALSNPARDSAKLVTYSVLFLPPYFLFGALLSSYFTIGSDRIGQLYFFDLLGAGLGCILTPLMFTFTDLRPTIMMLLFLTFLLVLNTTIKRKVAVVVAMAVIYCTVHVLSANETIFKEEPNVQLLARTLLRPRTKDEVQEVDVKWNSLARTTLIRAAANSRRAQINKFTVTQDDGISNVHVFRYDPDEKRETIEPKILHHSFPYILGKEPENVLVMFAGVGRDMVFIDRLAQGKARITGVELNEAVTDLAYHPAVFNMNLHNFLRRPNINLLSMEGRDFLNNAKEKYDFIFLATNGSIHANRTGHSRKYLDTYEAMGAYLDHLTDDGMMVFANQSIAYKIVAFRKLFEERGMENFRQAIHVMGRARFPLMDTLVLKPDGFTPQEIAKIENKAQSLDRQMRRLYSPFDEPHALKRVMDLVARPIDRLDLLTDDSPFMRKVELTGFTLFPSMKQLKNQEYSSSWIKIFTVILFFFVSLVVVLAARFRGGKGSRVPLPWLLYFLVSGISYMCVEIGLIAKTELFLGNPLYAVAIILASFLVFNGIGALLQDTRHIMRGPKTLAVITVAAVIWSVAMVHVCNTFLLSVPLIVKILMVAVAVCPVGLALGMYYPLGVASLVEVKKESTVPMTYGIATLSSVLGSSFAMTAITNTGFSTMIFAGAAGYASVALIFVIAKKTVRA